MNQENNRETKNYKVKELFKPRTSNKSLYLIAPQPSTSSSRFSSKFVFVLLLS